jgi:hypothetical protein
VRNGLGLAAALACSTALAWAADSPPVGIEARPDRTEVTVGQTFTVEVQTSGPAGTVWSFPATAGTEAVELHVAPAKPGDAPPPPGTCRYTAAAFALSEVAVPPITASYRLPDGRSGTATSAAVPLKIAPLVPKAQEERSLADVRAPVPIPLGPYFWAEVLAAAALLALLITWLVRRRRRKTQPEEAPAAPPVPPDTEALAALDALAGSTLLGAGDYRAFYIVLAGIAKRYLERRLAVPVVEMTTTELVALLREAGYDRDLLPGVRDLAGAADFVKFAHGSAQRETAERHLAAARSLVATLERRLAPAAEAAP